MSGNEAVSTFSRSGGTERIVRLRDNKKVTNYFQFMPPEFFNVT